MEILKFEKRELKNKRQWPESDDKKSNGISLELRRLILARPEIFDPTEFHKKREVSFEEYLERRKMRLMADAVLATTLALEQPDKTKISVIAALYDFELIYKKRRGRLRLIG